MWTINEGRIGYSGFVPVDKESPPQLDDIAVLYEGDYEVEFEILINEINQNAYSGQVLKITKDFDPLQEFGAIKINDAVNFTTEHIFFIKRKP